MNPKALAIRTGWQRGLIELRHSFSTPAELVGHLLWPALMIGALIYLRDRDFGSTGFALGALALPSILGMNAAMGLMTMSQHLVSDREDGTLLRAKATPHGMVGYLVGKVVFVAGGLIADLLIFLIPGLILIDGLAAGSAGDWLTLMWVLLLGLAATLPLGAVLGSVLTTPATQGLIQLLVLGLIALSGIFYPISALPTWLEWIGQLTPIYWMGLGMRSALLPDAAVVVELGESWRHLETAGVLTGWAVAGLVLAPIMLRWTARRESGSRLAERRERALQRTI